MFIGETCAQHYISSVCAQTAVLIETQIGTNTHWGNRHKLWESVCIARGARNYGGAAVPCKREAGERARNARIHEWNISVRECAARAACIARSLSSMQLQ
jgi:hypothetical protein